MNIEKDIWRYGQLPEEMQQKIDLYVKDNIAFAEVLEQVKLLYQILPQSYVFTAEPADDAALSYYIANQYLGQAHVLPDVLRIGYETMKKRIDSDPALHERYETLRHRMEHIMNHSDPLKQFEALTGHRIEAAPKTVGLYAQDRSSSVPSGIADKLWSLHVTRGALALVVVLLGTWLLYGNRTARLAYTDRALLTIDHANLSFRGDLAGTSASLDRQFVYGQSALEESQHRWLGVFYTFDQERLELAETYFTNVLASSDIELVERSNFLLGKIELAKGNVAEARGYLQKAAAENAIYSDEASSLLERLDSH